MRQKDIFLSGEGNAWLTRNAVVLAKHEQPGSDPLLMELLSLKSHLAGSGTGGSGCVRLKLVVALDYVLTGYSSIGVGSVMAVLSD